MQKEYSRKRRAGKHLMAIGLVLALSLSSVGAMAGERDPVDQAVQEEAVLQNGSAMQGDAPVQERAGTQESALAAAEGEELVGAAASGRCGADVVWTLKNGVLTITGSGKMTDYDLNAVVSPFVERTDIAEVVIGQGVTSIGEYAFYGCSRITGVTIPSSVKRIGECALSGCTSLTGMTVPSSVTDIGAYAFRETPWAKSQMKNGLLIVNHILLDVDQGMKEVTVPSSVTGICGYAFAEHDALTSVTIPSSVTSIGMYAFAVCTALTRVTIPSSVTSIGEEAFAETPWAESQMKDGLLIVNHILVSVDDEVRGERREVTIPDSVTSIGDLAFSSCIELTAVTIPLSVTRIGRYAFADCEVLRDVYYSGSAGEWKRISVAEGNDELLRAAIHYGRKDEAVTGVTLSKSTLAMTAGQSNALTATVSPAGAADRTLTWKSSDPRVVTVDSTGKLTAVTIGTATVTAASSNGKSASCTVTVSFGDVPANAYYAPAVSWAAEKGITSGVSKTSFGPNQTCTRAQIVTSLYRAAGSPKASGSVPFTDVKKGSYYYNAVLWAVQKKITSGATKTAFAPDASCTRGQIVTFLWRFKGLPKESASGSFKDVPKKAYYTTAVNWAVKNKVTAGKTKTSFGPGDPCTRAHAVTFLYRAK